MDPKQQAVENAKNAYFAALGTVAVEQAKMVSANAMQAAADHDLTYDAPVRAQKVIIEATTTQAAAHAARDAQFQAVIAARDAANVALASLNAAIADSVPNYGTELV